MVVGWLGGDWVAGWWLGGGWVVVGWWLGGGWVVVGRRGWVCYWVWLLINEKMF